MATDQLELALNALINTQTPAERVRVLRDHAALILGDKARDLLDTNLSRARAEQDHEVVGMFQSVLSLVDSCRNDGLEIGIAKWRHEEISGLIRSYTQTDLWGARKKLLERFTEDLLSHTARELIDELIELNSVNENAVRALRETASSLDAVREHGIELVFDRIQQQLLEGLAEAVQAGREEEWDRFADSIIGTTGEDTRPEMYGELARVVLGGVDRDKAIAWIKALVERGVGQEQAILAGPKIRLEVGNALMEVTEGGDNTVIDATIDMMERSLAGFSSVEGTSIHGLHGTIATAYIRRTSEDRHADLKAAQRHLEEEIRATPRKVHAGQWAYTERKLGRVLEMLGEKRAALQHFERGVDIPPEQADEEYLDACMSIARIRMDTYGEDRVGQLEQAISGLEGVLKQAEEGSIAAAKIHRNLGDAYRRLQSGDPSENIKKALGHVEKALSVFDRDRFPDDWAQLQHNLGTIHYSNPGGDRAANIEHALACYRQTLEVHTRAAYPQYYGLTSAAMGMALLERIASTRSDNLSEALERLEDAVGTLDREESKTWWAECQTAIGALYLQRLFPDPRQNLQRAIDHLEAARLAYAELGNRQRENQACSNLAAAYLDLNELDGSINPKALRYAEAAVAGIDRHADPFDWAVAQRNLAAVLTRLRLDDNSHGPALDCLARALEVFTEELYPAEYSLTQNYVGHVHFDRGGWAPALSAYQASIRAGEAVLSSAYTEAGRRERVSETHLQHVRAAHCLLRLGRPADGLLRLEQGKTRLLGEALALAELDLTGLSGPDQEAIRSARQAIRELEAEMRQPVDTAARRSDRELADALRQARAELHQRIEEIRAERPDFMPTGLELPALLDLIPEGGALVAPLFTEKGSTAYVVPHGTEAVTAEHVIELEAFTGADLNALLRGPVDEPAIGGWLGAYRNHRLSPEIQVSESKWWEAIKAVGDELWDHLLGPVHEQLKSIGLEQGAPILFLPQGGLGLLPLHAASRLVEGERRYFLDDWTVTYVPSGYALSVSRERLENESRQKQALLAVINPTKDLDYTKTEGKSVAALFSDALSLPAESASLEAVMNAVPGRQYLHFSCHGFYHWQDPMQSGLVLAEDKPLTLSQIIAELDLDASRLVTLSACETGITDILRSPDEFLGLPAGFLQAGAPAVVSTLWAVDDLSTMLLMERFYQLYLKEGEDISEALRQAQIWLREVTAGELKQRFQYEEERALDGKGHMPIEHVSEYYASFAKLYSEQRPYAHPYYWAAFTFNGA